MIFQVDCPIKVGEPVVGLDRSGKILRMPLNGRAGDELAFLVNRPAAG